MADVRKTIEIVFGAIDNTGSGLSSLAQGVRSFTDGISGVTEPLSNIGDFALQAEASIIALGAALIGFSVNEAARFQQAQNEIGTLLGQNAEQAGAFGRDILAYSQDSTQAIDQITAATYSAISAGVAQADALSVVNAAERLAVAGKADLNATTVALVSTLNAYGASANDAARYSDVLFTTVRVGQTTIPELAASLANVTGIAAAAGVPIETLGGAIAALTASGLPTAQAITGIKSAISGIIQPSNEASEMAAQLGIQFNAAALESKGFEGVLADIARATGGNVEKVAQLFGSVEALNAVLALTSGGGAEKFNLALAAMESSAGATQKAFELMSSNGVLAFQNLLNNLQVSLITAGMPILEEFGGSIKGLADIFKALTFSIDAGAFDPLYQALGEAAAGLETFLRGVAAALPEALSGVDFTGLAASFEGVGGALAGIFGDLDLTKPDDLRRVIQFVVDSVESLTNVVQGIVQAWGPAIRTIVDLVEEFNQLSDGAKIATGETLGVAQVFEKTIKPVFDGVTGAVEGLGDAISLLAVAMGGNAIVSAAKLSGAISGLLPLLGKAGLVGAAGAAGFAIGNELNEPINDLVSRLTGSQTTLGGWIYDVTHSREEADKFAESVGGLGYEFGKWLAELAGGADETEKLGTATAEAARGVQEFANATEAAKGGAEGLAQGASALAEGLDGIVGAVSKVTTGPITEYYDALGNLVGRTVESQEALDAWNEQILRSGGVIDEAAEGAGKLAEANADMADATQKIIPIFDAATGKIIGYEQNLGYIDKTAKGAAKSQGETADAVAKTAKEMAEAEKAAKAWQLEMEKLASAERIALISQQTEIATEKIKANAEVMVAAFESVSESISSTNALIGELYGKTSDTDIFGFQSRKLLEEANRRANELTKAQVEMLNAQSELMRAQVETLTRGTGLISIEAAGLQPHLEAFMWEILKAIQVRVNADGLQMLLGAT